MNPVRVVDTSSPPYRDNRRIHRIPIRVVVSRAGRSAVLGQTRDLSLHGVFIATPDPLPVGSVLFCASQWTDSIQNPTCIVMSTPSLSLFAKVTSTLYIAFAGLVTCVTKFLI